MYIPVRTIFCCHAQLDSPTPILSLYMFWEICYAEKWQLAKVNFFMDSDQRFIIHSPSHYTKPTLVITLKSGSYDKCLGLYHFLSKTCPLGNYKIYEGLYWYIFMSPFPIWAFLDTGLCVLFTWNRRPTFTSKHKPQQKVT